MLSSISNRRLSSLAILASLGTLATPAGYAQAGTQGTVNVVVVDATGAVVPGASLSLIQASTNAERKAASRAKARSRL